MQPSVSKIGLVPPLRTQPLMPLSSRMPKATVPPLVIPTGQSYSRRLTQRPVQERNYRSLDLTNKPLQEDMIELEMSDDEEKEEDDNDDTDNSLDTPSTTSVDTPPLAPRKPKNYNSLPDLLQGGVLSNSSSASSYHSGKSSSSLPTLFRSGKVQAKLGKATFFDGIEEEGSPKHAVQKTNGRNMSNESLEKTLTADMFKNQTSSSPRNSFSRPQDGKILLQRSRAKEKQTMHLPEQNLNLDFGLLTERDMSPSSRRPQGYRPTWQQDHHQKSARGLGLPIWTDPNEKVKSQIRARLFGKQSQYLQ